MDAFMTLGWVTPLVSFKPEKLEGLAQIFIYTGARPFRIE